MKTLMGIDWSEKHHDVRIHNERGACVAQFQIEHCLEGFTSLAEKIEGFNPDPGNCLVAIETKHNLIVDFLWSRGYRLYILAPSQVKSNRGRFSSSGARTDDSDAELLMEIIRTDRGRLIPWQPDGSLVRQMRVQLRFIDDLTASIVQYRNRLRSALLRYYPQPLDMFKPVIGQTSLAFLAAYPAPAAAQALTYADFCHFCREQGYNRAKRLPQLFAQLQQPTPEPDPVVVAAYENQLPFLAQLLLTLSQQKKEEIKRLGALFAAHPDAPIFTSLPGAGDLLAPKLLVLFGDHRQRFPQPALVQALAGTCPVTEASGKKRIIYFRRACNMEYRQTAQQFA
jgi:transposase